MKRFSAILKSTFQITTLVLIVIFGVVALRGIWVMSLILSNDPMAAGFVVFLIVLFGYLGASE